VEDAGSEFDKREATAETRGEWRGTQETVATDDYDAAVKELEDWEKVNPDWAVSQDKRDEHKALEEAITDITKTGVERAVSPAGREAARAKAGEVGETVFDATIKKAGDAAEKWNEEQMQKRQFAAQARAEGKEWSLENSKPKVIPMPMVNPMFKTVGEEDDEDDGVGDEDDGGFAI